MSLPSDDGIFSRSLSELAAIGAPRIPAISELEISELFAHMLASDELCAKMIDQLSYRHFELTVEPHFMLVWNAVQTLYRQHSARPAMQSLSAEAERLLAIDPTAVSRDRLVGQNGLLTWLSTQQNANLQPDRGRHLALKFSRERAVFAPLEILHHTIVQPGQNGQAASRLQTANLESVIVKAAEELQALDSLLGPQEPWPALLPLDGPDLPPFPVRSLPGALRDWVEATATATQTPADLAGMFGLANCAAAAAKRVDIVVRAGWFEPINLFAVVALDPGNRKSAVYTTATQPLRSHEQELSDRHAPEIRAGMLRARVLEDRITVLTKSASRAPDAEARDQLIAQANALNEELARLPNRTAPKLIMDDATVEKVELTLLEQGGRIAVMSPEGGFFNFDRYSNGKLPAIGVFLKGHSGDDIRVDRIGRPSVFVAQPAVTVAIAVQPDLLRGLGDVPALREQGLLARCLFSVPRSLLGHRNVSPPPVSSEITGAYRELVVRLCHLPTTPQRLTLSVEALVALDQFSAELEPRLAQTGDLVDIRDWAGKLAGAVVRVAGILHLAELVNRHGPTVGLAMRPFAQALEPINVATMHAAIALGNYFTEHARAVFSMIGARGASSVELADAQQVLAWIRRTAVTTFTRRDAHQNNRSRFRKVTDVDRPLKLISDAGYIRPLNNSPYANRMGSGRPGSPRFEVNPAVFDGPPTVSVLT